MEGGKKKSIVTELFGEKDSPTAGSSSGILDSIFGALPDKVYAGDNPSETEKTTENPADSKEKIGGEGQSKDGSTSQSINSYFRDEKLTVHPFQYGSSIYYGVRDFYIPNPEPEKSPVFSTFDKDGGEDDSAGATRGNWWQGSLYY